MPNNYFQFKNFTINQEHSAMKVCTDSCLFGAWVAKEMELYKMNPGNILDIGTGTGLLSLMLAQKTTADIDAIDIDSPSCNEAGKNFTESQWSERLQGFHSDITKWITPHKYDLVICNPPFYENDMLPANDGKIISKHSSSLSVEDLLIKIKALLNVHGYFAVMIPFNRSEWFVKTAIKYSLYAIKQLEVKQTTAHFYFRSMFILQHQQKETIKNELSIKDNSNAYTKEFIDLLKDYYLYL